MKGLLLKDFYMAVRYCRMYLVIAAVFLAISLTKENDMFFILYPVVLAAMLPVTLLAYDERCKWDVYCQTMPYSKSQFVSGKYLVSLIGMGVVWLLSVMLRTGMVFGSRGSVGQEMAGVALVMFSIGLLVPGLVLPVVLKFGSEKGRIMYYLAVILVMGGGAAGSYLQKELHLTFFLSWFPLLLLGAAVVIFVGSWLLSIRLYESREL